MFEQSAETHSPLNRAADLTYLFRAGTTPSTGRDAFVDLGENPSPPKAGASNDVPDRARPELRPGADRRLDGNYLLSGDTKTGSGIVWDVLSLTVLALLLFGPFVMASLGHAYSLHYVVRLGTSLGIGLGVFAIPCLVVYFFSRR